MQIVVVGLSHTTSNVAAREPLACTDADLPAALARLRGIVEEGFILSTCNRIELYGFVGHAESGARRLTEFLAESGGTAPDTLQPSLYVRAHEHAVRHFFRTAAGLDSMALGEDQIQFQLKRALAAARDAGSLGPVLDRLGNVGLAVGKRVRSRTGIARDAVSMISLAIEAAAARLGGLAGRHVAILGAGRTAKVALQHIADAQPASLTIVARDQTRAEWLDGMHGSAVRPWSELEAALRAADLVVSCTSAPDIVLGAAEVARARTGLPRSLVCVDLAVPRDIDPAVGALDGVTLIDIDALEPQAAANRARRSAEIGDAEAIVVEGVDAFMEWWQRRQVVPAITALRSAAEAIRDAELERALARLPGLGEREHIVIRGMAARIVNKLLHAPIAALKSDPEGANMAQILQQLFGLAPAVEACPARSIPPALAETVPADAPR